MANHKKEKKSKTTYHLTPNKRDSRVGLIDEIEPKYSHYLCFTVSVRTNKIAHLHRPSDTVE